MNDTEHPDTASGPAVARPVQRHVRPLEERLEAAAHAWENSLTVCGDHMPGPAMLREAKAEIERLRNALRPWVESYGGALWVWPDTALETALETSREALRPNDKFRGAREDNEQ